MRVPCGLLEKQKDCLAKAIGDNILMHYKPYAYVLSDNSFSYSWDNQEAFEIHLKMKEFLNHINEQLKKAMQL